MVLRIRIIFVFVGFNSPQPTNKYIPICKDSYKTDKTVYGDIMSFRRRLFPASL